MTVNDRRERPENVVGRTARDGRADPAPGSGADEQHRQSARLDSPKKHPWPPGIAASDDGNRLNEVGPDATDLLWAVSSVPSDEHSGTQRTPRTEKKTKPVMPTATTRIWPDYATSPYVI